MRFKLSRWHLLATRQVGENGIEAAAAAEAEAGEGGDDGGGYEADIKAAGASIRAWRFVQVRRGHGGTGGAARPCLATRCVG